LLRDALCCARILYVINEFHTCRGWNIVYSVDHMERVATSHATHVDSTPHRAREGCSPGTVSEGAQLLHSVHNNLA